MNRVFDHLREHLLTALGALVPKRVLPLDQLRQSQWSPKFERLQRNRLVMGGFRYGLLTDQKAAGGNSYDNVGSLIARAKSYQESGNLEHLVDVANLAMVEFETSQHPNRHWAASDDREHVEQEEAAQAAGAKP